MDQTAFEAAWLKAFAPSLTAAQYEDCFLNEYLWHLFSYRLLPADSFLEGDPARAAYDAADKEGAVSICLWSEDAKTVPLPPKLHTAKALDRRPETCVVGKAFAWTYVSTHENGRCGPYFHAPPHGR